MHLRHLALAPALIVVVAACSSAGASPSASSGEPSAAPASASAAQTRIEVSLSDSLKMEPASMTVPAGMPVTFVVTNSGGIDHEFFLGDEGAQMKHEEEMMSSGGMTMDEPDGIVIKPGETKELTHTFASAGESMAGCHVTGHYGAGMKAAITVTQ